MTDYVYRSGKLCDVISTLRRVLAPKFGEREATSLLYFALEQLKGWSGVQVAMRRDEEISDYLRDKLESTVKRLLADEPIQYIFGVAHFYGMTLHVGPSTLIPRPETAQLVDMIVAENDGRSDLRILDIGTGSGCIAIALARNLRFPMVTASDISADAIEIAKANTKILKAVVDFRLVDALDAEAMRRLGKFDIIVSNPPYIIAKEAENMEANVLDHEPHTALFVPDNDPLRFYTPIAHFATENLVAGGRLYFEINPLFANELREMLGQAGFEEIDITKDFEGRDRFCRCRKPE